MLSCGLVILEGNEGGILKDEYSVEFIYVVLRTNLPHDIKSSLPRHIAECAGRRGIY